MNFRDFTIRWERTVLALKKPATIATMQSHVRKLNGHLGGLPVSDLDQARVQEYLTAEAALLSPKGVKNLWGTFRLILKTAKREGLISALPEPELPRCGRRQQPWLTISEMKAAIGQNPEKATLLRLLAETGLRQGELAGLRWQDVDLDAQTLTVRQSIFRGRAQEPKTFSALRTISISKGLVAMLRQVVGLTPQNGGVGTETRNKFVFAARNGSPVRFDFAIHPWRRGAITIWAQLGMPEKVAAARAGHSLPGITFGLYAQGVSDREWAEKIGESLDSVV